MPRVSFAAFAVCLLLSAASARAEDDCRLQIAASLPMDVDRTGRIEVPAAIGGHPINMLVDTGSPASVLRQGMADALSLKSEIVKAPVRFEVFGGVHLYHYVKAKEFSLGGMKAAKALFLLIQDDALVPGQDGLLGADFLFNFDVDFDFANAKLNLFAPHRCEGRAVYWTQDEAAIAKVPISLEDDRHIDVPIRIDGKPLKAIFDTGASHTVMNLETGMDKFGLTPESPGMQRLGKTSDPNPSYGYIFKTLTFEGVTVNNPVVVFVPEEKSQWQEYKALLGIGILRQLHLYIAYKERMLYVTAASAH